MGCAGSTDETRERARVLTPMAPSLRIVFDQEASNSNTVRQMHRRLRDRWHRINAYGGEETVGWGLLRVGRHLMTDHDDDPVFVNHVDHALSPEFNAEPPMLYDEWYVMLQWRSQAERLSAAYPAHRELFGSLLSRPYVGLYYSRLEIVTHMMEVRQYPDIVAQIIGRLTPLDNEWALGYVSTMVRLPTFRPHDVDTSLALSDVPKDCGRLQTAVRE